MYNRFFLLCVQQVFYLFRAVGKKTGVCSCYSGVFSLLRVHNNSNVTTLILLGIITNCSSETDDSRIIYTSRGDEQSPTTYHYAGPPPPTKQNGDHQPQRVPFFPRRPRSADDDVINFNLHICDEAIISINGRRGRKN